MKCILLRSFCGSNKIFMLKKGIYFLCLLYIRKYQKPPRTELEQKAGWLREGHNSSLTLTLWTELLSNAIRTWSKGDCPMRSHSNSLIERKPTGIIIWPPQEMDFAPKNVIISLTPGYACWKAFLFIHSFTNLAVCSSSIMDHLPSSDHSGHSNQ